MVDFYGALETFVRTLEFRDPAFLLLALLAPVVFFVARRLSAAVTYSSLSIPNLARKSWRVRAAQLPALLLGLAAVLLAISIAGPRTGDSTSIIKRDGIAIMLAVDRSGSMDARDFVKGDLSINRLEAVKQVLREFVSGGEAGAGREHDLIGLVSFGTYADGICPLTLDHANMLQILEQLDIPQDRAEAQTAIGEGLALAVERLRVHAAKSKVIILLTDGVNTAGDIAPLQAAELAKAHDIRVYTVGAGTSGVAPVPVRTRSGRLVLSQEQVEIDETTLEAIATRTGGKYFNAKDAKALKETYRAIDELERSEISEIRYLQYEEHYVRFIIGALLLVALSGLLAGTALRRLP